MKQVQPAANKQQLLNSFLGMMTYLFIYKQDISEVTPDLVGLIKKDALFQRTEGKDQISEDVCCT